MTKVQPIGDQVIIKPKQAEQETNFGLLLTDTKAKPMTGTVVAVSDKLKDKYIKEGDTVLFKKYAPVEFTVDDEEMYCVDFEDVLAKFL